MNRRICAAAALGALAISTVGLTTPATADDPPLHGHVMLVGAEFTGTGPGTVITSIRNCVTLAAGKQLPLHVHHSSVHRGRAGEALRNAGNLVVPLAPLSPFTGCDDFAHLQD